MAASFHSRPASLTLHSLLVPLPPDNGGRTQRVPREICLVMEYCEMDLCGIVRAMRLTPAHIRYTHSTLFFISVQ
jgi:hypothetical protein